jgi:hypothetical protein
MAIRTLLALTLLIATVSSHAQSRRLPELRSCLTSEFALAAVENSDPKKNYQENEEIGKRIGYVIAEHYQTSIWALDDPKVEGRSVVYYAATKAEDRMKYMSKIDLQRDVKRCRASFEN